MLARGKPKPASPRFEFCSAFASRSFLGFAEAMAVKKDLKLNDKKAEKDQLKKSKEEKAAEEARRREGAAEEARGRDPARGRSSGGRRPA